MVHVHVLYMSRVELHSWIMPRQAALAWLYGCEWRARCRLPWRETETRAGRVALADLRPASYGVSTFISLFSFSTFLLLYAFGFAPRLSRFTHHRQSRGHFDNSQHEHAPHAPRRAHPPSGAPRTATILSCSQSTHSGLIVLSRASLHAASTRVGPCTLRNAFFSSLACSHKTV